MCLAGGELRRIVTESAPPSVSSTGTMVVAPAGTGAPVMIRCAVAGCSVNWSVRPAGMSSATGSTTGCSACGRRDVLGAHRVAVHRRVVENRQRQLRDYIVGQHQPLGLAQRDRERRAGADHLGYDALMFID